MRTKFRWVGAGVILLVDAAIVIAECGGGTRSVALTMFDATFALDAVRPPAPIAPPATIDAPAPPAPSPVARRSRATPFTGCAPHLHHEPGRGCIPDDGRADAEAAPFHGPALAVGPAAAAPAHPAHSVASAEDREAEQRYAASDVEGAIALARTQCGRGDPFGCALAGSIELREQGPRRSADGEALLEKACTLGDTWGCTRVMDAKARR